MAEPLLYSYPDACKQLGGISLRHLYELIHSGKLARIKIGGRAFVHRDELIRIIACLAEKSR